MQQAYGIITPFACRSDNPTYGPAAPSELIDSGLVLPVLDGLDELPEPLQASAIDQLDRARADRPLVVTCRGQEYQHAVAAGGETLAAAAVVELEPVTAAEAIAFLRRAAAPTPERWDRVAAHLDADPDGALAAALSTPLMVALARTIYTSPGRDPSKLVDRAQTDGRAAVERHLLDGFIPAVFAALPQAPGSLAPRRRWDPQAARRWLQVLAGHLDRQHTRDLAWWELHSLLPAWAGWLLVWLTLGLAAGLGPVRTMERKLAAGRGMGQLARRGRAAGAGRLIIRERHVGRIRARPVVPGSTCRRVRFQRALPSQAVGP
jgi:hypothetical protein